MSEVKFCKDCDFCKGSLLWKFEFARCKNPKFLLKDTDPVTGKTHHYFPYCEHMRDQEPRCGKSGRYFEPRVPFFQKLISFFKGKSQ